MTLDELLRQGLQHHRAGRLAPSGRVSASILTTLGLTDWIAATPDTYVALAQQHAADPAALATLRLDLRARLAAAVICDHARYTRAVEAAYRTIWRRWCQQQPGS